VRQPQSRILLQDFILVPYSGRYDLRFGRDTCVGTLSLVWPVCAGGMRTIAWFAQAAVVEKLLTHPGHWPVSTHCPFVARDSGPPLGKALAIDTAPWVMLRSFRARWAAGGMARTMAASRKAIFRWRARLGRFLLHAFLLSTSVLFVMPLLWGLFTSFKQPQDIITQVPTLLPTAWTLENYAKLPRVAPFVRFFVNSIVVSAVSTLFIAVSCTAAGYIFAKYEFRFKKLLFFTIIATILIPLQTYIVPLFLTIRALGWVNSYAGLIYPTVIMSSGIFFMRQNILGIPDELIDAARVDGSSEFAILWNIIFPLSTAPVAAICIINWVFTWSLFIWPLVVASSSELFTMELGLMYFMKEFIVDYGGIMAATTLTILPVLTVFLVFRTRIIEGVATTGMKG
jgi:ABC-type glycerol-3-phosphate transport system permease component